MEEQAACQTPPPQAAGRRPEGFPDLWPAACSTFFRRILEVAMFERILVPLDGSARAELILSQVARILQREDSEILLLRVVDVPAAVGRVSLRQFRELEREEAQKYIHNLVRRFRDRGVKIHGKVVEGAPAEAILEAARTEGATLIAMSTHGRTGL